MTVTIQTDDLETIVPFEYRGVNYELRSATGEAARAYRNHVLKSTTLGPNGKPQKVDGLADAPIILLSFCVFESGKDRPVTASILGKWPERLLGRIFEACKQISDLEEKTDLEEAGKNEQNG